MAVAEHEDRNCWGWEFGNTKYHPLKVKNMRVLAFGEILFDIIEGKHYLGGAPLNFAAHLAKLGAESYIFSRIGNDDLGHLALGQIERHGVNTTFIQRDHEHETGTVEVFIENGQPDYTIHEKVAYDFIGQDVLKNKIKNTAFDILYYGTLAQRNDYSRNALSKLLQENTFSHVFYDVNLRKGFYSKEIVNQSLRNCTILKLNDEEVVVLGKLLFLEKIKVEDFAFRVAMKFGIDIVIITAGAEGCLIYENEELSFVKGFPANVVDTVGAGDSFSAAFLFQYFHHKNPILAAEKANQLGAFVASSRGPIPDYSEDIIKALALE